MTLDQLIAELNKLKETVRGDAKVTIRGDYQNCGNVLNVRAGTEDWAGEVLLETDISVG